MYGGNSPLSPSIAARLSGGDGSANNPDLKMLDGVPYARTRVNVENMIPILSAVGAVSQGLTAAKLSQVEQGKTFTAPKTGAGKLIGRITGRTQAAAASQQMAQSSAPVSPGTAKNLLRQNVPVSGAVSFGAEQNQTLKILGLLSAAIVAIFYFNSQKKGRKRRR